MNMILLKIIVFTIHIVNIGCDTQTTTTTSPPSENRSTTQSPPQEDLTTTPSYDTPPTIESTVSDPANETDPTYSTWGPPVNDTTPSQPPTQAEPTDVDDSESHLDDKLTQDAFSRLYEQNLNSSMTTSQAHQASVLRWEWWLGLRHFGDQNTFARSCYIVATTYRNAMLDLRSYYPLRYLYYDNVEYEVGYITQEIILKYQISLEIFHLIQRKFYMNQDRLFATPSYVLYMYTNVLYQTTDIIHLCNMLHEIEAKYKNYQSKGPFGEEPKSPSQKGNRTLTEKEEAIQNYLDRLRKIKKKWEREERERMKMIKKGKVVKLTEFTTKKRKSYWDLYYGWSIEDW